MTGKNQKKYQKVIGLITILLILFGANAYALQEKISTLSDYLYKKDLEKYNEIKAETDSQKKVDLLAALLKERPISRILYYAATDYMVSANKIAGSNWDRLISLGEALRDLVPTDAEIQAEAEFIPVGLDEFKKEHLLPTRSLVLKTLAAAYSQKKNYSKAAELAEKAYAIAPDKQMTETLYGIYIQLGNEGKIITYGQKMLKEFPLREQKGYTTALQLADIYLKKQDINAATQLFSKLMNIYGNSVPPNIPEANWNRTRSIAYTLMAQDAYNKKDYSKAESLYQKVLTFDSRRDDAYYFLGMCRWKAKDQKGAIVYFARCSVLNKDYAARARQYLEDLSKAEYPSTFQDELNKAVDQAKSDLGIS